jgi:Uma2 family endonuclease
MLSHMRADVEKRRFSVDEYYAMADAGILSRDDRVELVDGEILAMTPIGPTASSGSTIYSDWGEERLRAGERHRAV